jgi:hypothetical protein
MPGSDRETPNFRDGVASVRLAGCPATARVQMQG